MPHLKNLSSITAAALTAIVLMTGCSGNQKETQFSLLSSDDTNIDFVNNVTSTRDFNIVNYMYFYDGAGVAAGDVNNDGLSDLFFVGNEVSNKLYLNRGDFEFEDVTQSTGIIDNENAWSTGVTMADVTGDGYLDIYVSRVNYLNKFGANQFFVNNGDGTFTEMAEEYGIDFEGYSTQSVFFDYNSDGRLDLFILNQSFHSERSYGPADILRQEQDLKAGDRLFRNDGDSFTDVTLEAGIISSSLGYGLGVAISDIDLDGDADIYVGNDFHEKDYLYINNGDGTFTESLYDFIGHTSNASMGNDIADLNNDGYPDIVSLDMMPDNHESFLRSGGPDLVVVEETKKNFGFGDKNARNTVQIHGGLSPDGDPFFSEMAFTLGMARTDWSWASLLADFDNSGTNDLFVTNGMVRRPNDLDYIRRVGNFRDRSTGDRTSIEEFESIQFMPRIFTPNYFYSNNGDLSFSNTTVEKGLAQPSYSSGAVYSDLNNDGLLDLVVNNVNMDSFIYRNSAEPDSTMNYMQIRLDGSEFNRNGIGAKVIAYGGGETFFREQVTTRGFQSSVDPLVHIGLGSTTVVDSLVVIWPDGSFQTVEEPAINQVVNLSYNNASDSFDYSRLHRNYDSADIEADEGIATNAMSHIENEYSDFSQEPLIPYMISREGPAIAVGDVTGNGLDDIYIGSAHRQEPKLFLQTATGEFELSGVDNFVDEAIYEDVDALFFDANGDGLNDLYVVSGGGQLFQSGLVHRDRLYINAGDGTFNKSAGSLPDFQVNGSVVRASDVDQDGDMDLFVGGRSKPWNYGQSPRHALLINDGNGNFEDHTERVAPGLSDIGMVTDAVWTDFTGDSKLDLVVVGEWMSIQIFENRGGNLEDVTQEMNLDRHHGLWQSIASADIEKDGDMDLIVGNFGTNSRMQVSEDKPLSLIIKDFNDNGYSSGLVTMEEDGVEKPFEQLDELLQEFPQMTENISSYQDFAQKSVEDLLGGDALEDADRRHISELRSIAIINEKESAPTIIPLPVEAQAFPVKDMYIYKSNSETNILMAGNHYGVKPSYGGRQDAGYGLHLTFKAEAGFKVKTHQQSGFFLRGEVRNIAPLSILEDESHILVGINDKPVQFYRIK